MVKTLSKATLADPRSADRLANIEYRVANGWYDRSAAFRLVYRAYLRAGLTHSSKVRMRVTPYQLLDSTVVFLATLRRAPICTVSLVGDGDMGLPIETVYGGEVDDLRARGLRLGEVSALADRRRKLSRTLPVFVSLTRLLVQCAQLRGIDRLLVAVHPRHARFYERFLAFQRIAEEKPYPLVRDNPAVALQLDLNAIDPSQPMYPAYFGERIPPHELESIPMTPEELELFGGVVSYGVPFTQLDFDGFAGGRTGAA